MSDDAAAIIDAALARQECVLERKGQRRVILLDGRSVITEGEGGQRARHVDGATAREAFRQAILEALSAGFAAAPRDPPKRTTFVQPQRTPEPVSAPAAPTPRAFSMAPRA